MKKLLIHTDSPMLQSGFARCGRELAKRFYEKKHIDTQGKEERDFEISYAAWHYFNKRYDFPYFLYPLSKADGDEPKQFKVILGDSQPDLIFSIGDLWNFQSIYEVVREYKETKPDAKWILWLTVDGEHLHPSWKQVLDYADDVNVFSNFAKNEINLYSGIQANIVYPGVDREVFHPIKTNIKDNSLPFNIGQTFLVLNVNQNTDRKNIPLTLEGFRDFAKDKEDVFMMLVTDPEDPHGYDLWDFIKSMGLNKKVAITREAGPLNGMSDAKLNLMYNLASVSINTSIGEGLSLPTLEAMAVGTPVLATDYAAVPELINQGGGIKLKIVGHMYGFNGIRRALVSKEDVTAQLNIMYQDYKTDKKLKNWISEKSQKFASMLTWDRTANIFFKRIDKVLEKKQFNFVRNRVKIKEINPLIVIPSWGTHCGIAEYTKSLFDAIRVRGQHVVTLGTNDYETIIKIVEEGKYNVVNIEHEFSFFKDKEALSKILKKLNEMKVKTILTMHSLVPGLVSHNESILTNVDELIVHADFFKQTLMKRFDDKIGKFIPETCNIEVIPMGCGDLHEYNVEKINETKKQLGIAEKAPIIGSFGFLRDQKGYQNLLLAIKLLKEEGFKDVLALLVCPPHEFGSKTYDESFFNFIERQGMKDNVLIIREYLKEEKLLDVLQCADVFVLNYQDQPSGGGISAAVKTLFRTQRPIIVNDGIAFADLTNEVLKIKSVSPLSLIEPIKNVLENKELAEQLVKNANKYIENNNWECVAQKHLDLYAK